MFVDGPSLEIKQIKQNKFRKLKPKAMMNFFFSLGQNIFLQKSFFIFDSIILFSLNILSPCTTTANKTS